MQKKFDAIIVDTCAFDQAQLDFLGLKNNIIPAFYDYLQNSRIQLLNSPILIQEVIAHIKNKCEVVKEVSEIQKTLENYPKLFALANIDSYSVFEKLQMLDIKSQLIKKFEEYNSTAQFLPYGNPEQVFNQYFSVLPPFQATGNKKREFPDAFVLTALKDYIDKNNKCVLVVSNDSDWKNYLCSCSNAIIVNSLNEAINELQHDYDFTRSLYNIAEAQLKAKLEEIVFECAYTLPLEFEATDDLDIEQITITDFDEFVTPLKQTDNSIMIQFYVSASLDGSTTIFDWENSIWCSEEHCYISQQYSYLYFENATALLTCEAELSFNSPNIEKTCTVKELKIVKKDIELELDNAKKTWKSCGFDTI